MALKNSHSLRRTFVVMRRTQVAMRRSLLVGTLFVGTLLGGLLMSIGAVAAPDSVTPSTFKELNSIQEQIAADQTDAAFSALKTLHGKVEKDSLDEALVLQMMGYTQMGANKFKEAIDYLKRSLATNRLPEQVKYQVGYMVAQLYAAQDNYPEALNFAEGWFKTLENPTPDQMIFMANIFAQTGDYKMAIPYVKQAINSGSDVKESWYQLWIASSFELKDYAQSAQALQGAIEIWPEKSNYWEQLASVYVAQELPLKGLASLQLAWKLGVLEKEASIRSLVQLAASHGVPDMGARLLEAALAKQAVPSDKVYLELLANAWVTARENDKAIAAFNQLAEVSDNRDAKIRIANIYVEQAKWDQAEKYLREGLKGKVTEPGKAWLVLGIVMTEKTQFDQGLDAFRKARAYAGTEKQASSWLKYAEDLRRQHNWQERNREDGDA